MYLIQQITSAPHQSQTLVLPDGTSFSMTMYFVSLQQGWFITNLVYNKFAIQGLRIVNSPNMLYQFRNQIPFGLACFSTANREPSLQEDFSSGASQLYVLSQDEVQSYTHFLMFGTT